MSITLSNGCFDLLHPGHIKFLQYCINLTSELGADKFILALDSDAKMQRDKGNLRPILSFEERKKTIESFFKDKIDKIYSFDSNKELENIIKKYKPILIKGECWRHNIVGKQYAKDIIFYPIDKNFYSTTDIINKMLEKSSIK